MKSASYISLKCVAAANVWLMHAGISRFLGCKCEQIFVLKSGISAHKDKY
jgi:hypothetical protein